MPVTITPALRFFEHLTARDTRDAVMAKPGIVGNLFERRFKTSNVEGLVTHVAEHDALFIVVKTTSLTTFAVKTLPRSDELVVQWGAWVVTIALSMVHFGTPYALNHLF